MRALARKAEAGTLTFGDVFLIPEGLAIIDIPSPRLRKWYMDVATMPPPFDLDELKRLSAALQKLPSMGPMTLPEGADMMLIAKRNPELLG